MLDRSRTRIRRSYEIDVLSTVSIAEAGLAVTSVLEAGKQKGRPSNGIDNTVFLGFSWGDYLGNASTMPKSVTGVFGAADSGGTGYAAFDVGAVLTGTADMVVALGTGYGTPLALSGDTSPAVGEYYLQPDGRTIITDNANAGANVFVAARYTPSATEFLQQYGDAYLPSAAVLMKRIGIIASGEVFTSNYDTAINWANIDTLATAEVLRAGANGRLTVNSAGALCRNTTVLSAPSAGDPWLGLRIEL